MGTAGKTVDELPPCVRRVAGLIQPIAGRRVRDKGVVIFGGVHQSEELYNPVDRFLVRQRRFFVRPNGIHRVSRWCGRPVCFVTVGWLVCEVGR